jgi:hypothetical protein
MIPPFLSVSINPVSYPNLEFATDCNRTSVTYHGHEVTEPLMCQFVTNSISSLLLESQRRRLFIKEQSDGTVGDQA